MSLGLPVLEIRPLDVEIGQAEYLREVDRLAVIELLCPAKLLDTGCLTGLVDLRRDEQIVAQIGLARDLPESGIVVGIPRLGIDHAAAVRDERP